MSRETRMRKILQDSFAPISLEITDDSASHAGHAGHREEGETHYNLEITSEISKNPILSFKNASTAISFAAFNIQGLFPPLFIAS